MPADAQGRDELGDIEHPVDGVMEEEAASKAFRALSDN